MVILEAYACGTPILASRIGSLDEIVAERESGVKFEPGNPVDLADKLDELRADPLQLQTMRRNARKLFEEHYTADRNYPRLLDIYDRALADFDETRHCRR
jgi:glycosyltransferase involved in cell wall biosynthesis